MANIITAGNSSNGGTAISTDTSGTLNIVTGSGSGANAITIDASQNVAMSAAQTVAGNLTVTGTLTAPQIFGQGQTWQTVTGSRALATSYTNSTGRPIAVSVLSGGLTAGNNINGNVGGINVAFAQINTAGTSQVTINFIVPIGATYIVTASAAFSAWYELR
jgi:hypothetical protein